MLIIGLCGGSGSGKGAVAEIFRKFGIPTVDTDLVYRDITSYESECVLELKEEFGSSIVSDGALDRRALAAIVFDDRSRLPTLNRITHKHILARTRSVLEEFARCGNKIALVEAPLLFESGLDNECDITVGVIADTDIRIRRIIARDSIGEAEARARVSAQLSNSEIISRVDEVIVNNGDLSHLEAAVTDLIIKIKNKV